MKNWSDTQWFTAGDANSSVVTTTPVVNSGTTGETTNVWPSTGDGFAETAYTEDAETSAAGGSSSVPAITVITDYWLRNELGEIITDESGNSLSLESV